MSSILTSVVAPTSSIVASTSQASSSARSDVQNTQANNNGQAASAAISQAAVVTLRSSSEGRSASTGENKMVDASFNKEAVKKDKASEEKQAATKKSVSVTA